MRRREFVTMVGGAAVAWPLALRAQQPAMPVIGYLSYTSAEYEAVALLPAFRQGLREIGFVEGQNVTIEYRWADFQYERLAPIAADLVRHSVTAITALGGTPPALVAKTATSTIPIVFQAGINPVEFGLVKNLNRPLQSTHLVEPRSPASSCYTKWRQRRPSLLCWSIHNLLRCDEAPSGRRAGPARMS
jgi:putative ABC transport system substrate-binding protein